MHGLVGIDAASAVLRYFTLDGRLCETGRRTDGFDRRA